MFLDSFLGDTLEFGDFEGFGSEFIHIYMGVD
jgi:hypothetical protein